MGRVPRRRDAELKDAISGIEHPAERPRNISSNGCNKPFVAEINEIDPDQLASSLFPRFY